MPSGQTVPLPPVPISIDDETPGLRTQPPAAGEHSDPVLSWAGYDAAQIAQLRGAGIIA
jgi:crotonobetainyl-CoA:carnitine CoA-transferase CaiB-like acyl-CoA transferase